MASKMERRVLCFPAPLLREIGYFQGVSTDVAKYFPTVVTPPHCRYVPRAEAERNPELKQVIPYVVFAYGESVFAYRRGKRGSESRLHELYSIGVGGHIEAEDVTLFSTDEVGYYDAMWREVAEEIVADLPRPSDLGCVALINDDTTDVGRVHFGLVHVINLATPDIKKRESVITDSGLIPLEKALAQVDRYETWSQLCLSAAQTGKLSLGRSVNTVLPPPASPHR